MDNYTNPWKTLSRKTIYSNEWITVHEDAVIHPDGSNGTYSVVDTRLAVGIVALTENREIYLVGQWRYPINQYSWEIVEGGGDEGEDPLDTAKRELREEAGLVADKWQPLGGHVYLSNCFSREKAVFFLAQSLSYVGSQPDSTEILSVKKVFLDDAISMVKNGEITDAMSVIAIERVKDMC